MVLSNFTGGGSETVGLYLHLYLYRRTLLVSQPVDCVSIYTGNFGKYF